MNLNVVVIEPNYNVGLTITEHLRKCPKLTISWFMKADLNSLRSLIHLEKPHVLILGNLKCSEQICIHELECLCRPTSLKVIFTGSDCNLFYNVAIWRPISNCLMVGIQESLDELLQCTLSY
jgi:hypothetical protein